MAELLAAIRLASPSLPIGAFAYSHGLEVAVEQTWVSDRRTAWDWISGVLVHSVGRFDVPLLSRLYTAWSAGDWIEARHLDAWVLAGRESAELQAEERHLGKALLRLLDEQRSADATDGSEEAGTDEPEGGAEAGAVDAADKPASDWSGATGAETFEAGDPSAAPLSYVATFALAAVRAGLSRVATLSSYCYAWLEHQTSAAARLVPLGQTDTQAILRSCLDLVDGIIARGATLSDDEIGAVTPGLAVASAWHETQHTRLFRS